MTQEALPLLDLEVVAALREATGDDQEFIADLVRTYVEEGASHLAQMDAAIAVDDVAALVRPAHTMKSSSASLGAMRLSEVCRDIEDAARRGLADDIAGKVELARTAWNDTLRALEQAGLAS
jgi:HPt (histidine-containing phosphotransfer) domain-containing protein